MHSKRLLCLLRKVILFLRLVKNGEVAGIKIQTKAIPLKTSIQSLCIKSGSSERLLQLYSGNEAETCAFNPGTENRNYINF
jgi:hypothetical protein